MLIPHFLAILVVVGPITSRRDWYVAVRSVWIMPKILSSVSLQYTSQPTPGIDILGTTTEMPFTAEDMEDRVGLCPPLPLW
jgi:hypothetical protein